MFTNVQRCSQMFKYVNKCSKMFTNVQRCSIQETITAMCFTYLILHFSNVMRIALYELDMFSESNGIYSKALYKLQLRFCWWGC